MKRRTFLVCTAALFCGALLAGGCTPKTSQPVLQQIEYSNLADSDTQDLLSKLLQDAGVSDLRIQTFFDHVQKFNNAVDPAWLTTGFENAKPLDLKYDPYSMQDAWTEKYDTFPGWNCRITACGLFGDFITVTGKADLDSAEDTLFMDYAPSPSFFFVSNPRFTPPTYPVKVLSLSSTDAIQAFLYTTSEDISSTTRMISLPLLHT